MRRDSKLLDAFMTCMLAALWILLLATVTGCAPQRALLPATTGALEQCRASYAFTDAADERIQSLCADEACREPWRAQRNAFLDATDKRCADVDKGTEVTYGKNR